VSEEVNRKLPGTQGHNF